MMELYRQPQYIPFEKSVDNFLNNINKISEWHRCQGCGEEYNYKFDYYCDNCIESQKKQELKLKDILIENFTPFWHNELSEQISKIDQWSKKPTSKLIFRGQVGDGKTIMSRAVMNGFKYAEKSIYFWDRRDMYRLIKQSEIGFNESGWAKLDQLSKYYCLVIEDLGSSKITDYMRQELASILDDRYENKTITIITMNLMGGKIRHDLGIRLQSRLNQDATVIDFPDKDYRIEEKA